MVREGKKCPKCGCDRFIVTFHVAQSVMIDDRGDYISTVSECDEVLHFADDEDIWDCERCGYSAPGKDMFAKKEEKE